MSDTHYYTLPHCLVEKWVDLFRLNGLVVEEGAVRVHKGRAEAGWTIQRGSESILLIVIGPSAEAKAAGSYSMVVFGGPGGFWPFRQNRTLLLSLVDSILVRYGAVENTE
jgi:hypothetical protein